MLYEVHYIDILCINWLKSDVVVFYIQQRENRLSEKKREIYFLRSKVLQGGSLTVAQ